MLSVNGSMRRLAHATYARRTSALLLSGECLATTVHRPHTPTDDFTDAHGSGSVVARPSIELVLVERCSTIPRIDRVK